MKRSLRLVFTALILCSPLAARADLSGDINSILADKLLAKGEVGVEVIRLGTSSGDSPVIYQSKATTPRIPASNLKLVTTATALEKLGPDFQFKTTLAVRGQDLALIGDGDPTFGDAEMLRKVGWGVDTVFKNWANMLKQRGITQVHDVDVDDSIFDDDFLPANWPVDQSQKRYEAETGGMNLNANCLDFYLKVGGAGQIVDFRTDPATQFANIRNTCVSGDKNAVWLSRQPGTNDIILRGETNVSNDEPVSVSIHDPPMFAVTVLAETLEANGIKVTGKVQRDRTIRGSSAWTPLAIHTTPITAVLGRANKDSMNLYAECLCKRIGAAVTNSSGSWQNGTAAVAAFLESLGVSKDEFNLDDGCGLSKKNTISSNAISKMLAKKFFDKDHQVYIDSLSVAGMDGTLENRFHDDLRGRVFGKSGYVVGVRSLSGYLKARDGEWFAFSILMNGAPEDPTLKTLQEKIVKAIDLSAGGGMASGR